jgi:hypothetical protein
VEQSRGDSMVVAADDAQFWKRSQAQQFLGTTAPFVWASVTFETDIRYVFLMI